MFLEELDEWIESSSSTPGTYRYVSSAKDIRNVVETCLTEKNVEFSVSLVRFKSSKYRHLLRYTLHIGSEEDKRKATPMITFINAALPGVALRPYFGIINEKGDRLHLTTAIAKIVHRSGQKVETFLSSLPGVVDDAVSYFADRRHLNEMGTLMKTPFPMGPFKRELALGKHGMFRFPVRVEDDIRLQLNHRAFDIPSLWAGYLMINTALVGRCRSSQSLFNLSLPILERLKTLSKESTRTTLAS
jgi:hypothetical protein